MNNYDYYTVIGFLGFSASLVLLAILLYMVFTADWCLKALDRSFLRLAKCKGKRKGGRRHSFSHLLH